MISIHALREEGDSAWTKTNSMPCNFYPRPPRGGRLARFEFTCPACKFLSTPSARRATHIVGLPSKNRVISIHALREEGDTTFRTPQQSASRFLSTTSARRATVNSFNVYIDGVFLSTPSARRATTAAVGYDDDYEFLSTPSARRATQVIHKSINIKIFLSTPSARRATLSSLNTGTGGADFYPRPPRGGRRISGKFRSNATGFLSTPSARRATQST